MRKSLFAIGLLAVSYSVQAQNVLCHVDTNANMYVSEGTLVYSGGGVQTRGNGLLDVHGNIMVVGATGDAFKTIDAAGAAKTDGGNIVLRMNTPASFATSTYGQLYIDGLSQSNITGVVSKEYRTTNHGGSTTASYYQQIALPFYGKALNTLSTELGKTFNTARYGNPILKWDNTAAVSNHFTNLATTTTDGPGYYMLKVTNNDWSASAPATGNVYTINGVPYAQFAGTTTLQNAGNVNFGINGSTNNAYNEKYNTYLDDSFEYTIAPWAGTYGKNFYQFGNPFLTNIDLSKIGYTESPTGSDGNAVTNIWGVEYNPGTVHTLSTGSTYSTDSRVVTFFPTGDGVAPAIGDVDLVVIKPMQSFKIKLRNNNVQTLNFNTLRRFKETARAAGTDYTVTAARHANDRGTIKQLGVIGLDANQKEIARTYYVVSPEFTTGHQVSVATTVQASAGKNIIGTFEESINGGYDNNNTNYWLYINEANEDTFKGKNVKLVNYYQDKVKFYKFEVRENAELIPAGVHQLSSGIGFYYKAENGSILQAKQGDIVPVTNEEANLYYGQPNDATLAIKDKKTTASPSRTLVVYDPSITNYIVRFDPNWKKADIEVYDMSGKLVISKKAVDASRDFVIELNNSIKNSYIVKIVSDKGETVNTKILK
ncbi:T9SS type A sorting domain-containing protein [Chryseobacterium sp. WG14]|uniref:T9SS type A sorting domain-containing protein n=1 Tax=unclassified Chryseobacterium TaxID=2593645 RepID=UPI00211E1940|nr:MULTISPECIES: T9SS type A sorting domain-containing protein [unclassified Chryseobacterium]MCQ9637488.1 T9SS type A sorting domain-containing protein [Chryseobacterium sp. WG23]MCQ9641905.1 T9SS type A sorting domain-containing protein [Chryseobacterium sp. WG14]